MDYKYINQLLERYWDCQTTFEEEAILRSFFSQDDIPASLLPYRSLFIYERSEVADDTLGEAFDKKMLSLVGEEKPVKARRISFSQRMQPLFKAVAIVAIILTLGNAMQAPFEGSCAPEGMAGMEQKTIGGQRMAQKDSATVDSVHRTSFAPEVKEMSGNK